MTTPGPAVGAGRAVTVARTALLAVAFVPAIIGIDVIFPFVSARTVVFRALVEIALAILLYLLHTRDYKVMGKRDYFFLAVFLFTGASALSAIFSPAPSRSLFGDFERMGGVWALLHYALFYVLLRVFFRPRDWELFFRLNVGVAAGLSLLAASQLWTLVNQPLAPLETPRVSATIGNPGLFGIYLMVVLAFALLVVIRTTGWRASALWAIPTVVILGGVFISQNRSSLLGIVLGGVVAGTVLTLRERKMRGWLVGSAAGCLALIVLGVLVVQRNPTGVTAESLPPVFSRLALAASQGDQTRIVFWKGAVEAFRDRPVLGYGPENFNIAWSANFSPEVYGLLGDTRLDRAHNAFLEVLATTGIVGSIAFAAMWIAIAALLFGAIRARALPVPELAIVSGLMCGYLFCLLFWFIDINSTPLWLAAVAFLAASVREPLFEFASARPFSGRAKSLFAGELLILTAALYLHGFETLRVGRALHRSQVDRSDMGRTLADFYTAIDSPVPLTSHTAYLLGSYLASFEPQFAELRNNPSTAATMDSAFKRSFAEFDDERRRDPRNEDLYTHEARLALVAAKYYQRTVFFDHAIRILAEAIELSPRRLRTRLILAYAYMAAGDNPRARAQLSQALSIHAESGQAWYYISMLEITQRNYPRAAESMKRSLKFRYAGNPSLYASLTDSLAGRKQYGDAADILALAVTEIARRTPLSDPPTKFRVLFQSRLPYLRAMAGDTAGAVAASAELLLVNPRSRAQIEEFLGDMRVGTTAKWATRQFLLPST